MHKEVPAEDLLASVARHDVSALSELYDRYAPRVYGLMAHILPERDAAEEVLQEAFVRLWNESPKLTQERRSVVAWLVITAREAAVERLRAMRNDIPAARAPGSSARAGKKSVTGRAKSDVPVPAASRAKSPGAKTAALKPPSGKEAGAAVMGPIPSTWMPQPQEVTMIDDRMVLLHKALNQLPKPQRHALELAVFRGLRESEIAAEMGEPLGKVRTSLRAAVTFVKHRRRAVCGTWTANI